MKTIIVLSAFAAVALAAPTLPEQGSEDFEKFANAPETFKRERKSPQDSNLNPAPEALANLPSTSQMSEFGVSGRSFGLKKPIIIKKKPLGYHVYRGSDEVPADSGETCGSQVKVKFCDSKTKAKSSDIEDTNTQMTEDDMKHSITLAKEAIENLQRDFNTVERKPSTQASSWNHGHFESDAELHQDIEVAREALEHIHKNFGNFESMSLHATTFKDATADSEHPFTITKDEEQRLAQWKEAIDNIQKNVEIAKNIEDSFRTMPDGETRFLVTDDTMTENTKHELNQKMDHNLRKSEHVAKQENKIESESCKTEHAHEKSSENEKHKEGHIEDDMASSASTVSEKKNKVDHMRQSSQSLTETKPNEPLDTVKSFENTPMKKDADFDEMSLNGLSQKNVMLNSMKSVEDNKEEKNKKIMFAENADSMASINEMKLKTVESEDMLMGSQEKSVVPTENFEKLEAGKVNHPNIKSAEHAHEQLNKKEIDKTETSHTEQSKPIDTTLFAKSAQESLSTNAQEKLQTDNISQKKMADNELEEQLAVAKMANNKDLNTPHEMLASVNDVEKMQFHQQPHQFHPEMRTTEDLKNMHQQLLMNPQSRWAEDKNMHMQRESMTSASGIHSHTVQHPGHQHHVVHGMKNHHFEIPSEHGQHSRFPEQFVTHEKSADPEMHYMSMRDGSGLAPDSNRFRWKPTHEAARTAYGAPVAPSASLQSGGAVGVFPNANIGGCGIPLLLSCNPSVVSGNLAKPPPYSAPAYRSEDDFTFLTKRDVKRTHENLPRPLHRTHNTDLKTNAVLVAKQ